MTTTTLRFGADTLARLGLSEHPTGAQIVAAVATLKATASEGPANPTADDGEDEETYAALFGPASKASSTASDEETYAALFGPASDGAL